MDIKQTDVYIKGVTALITVAYPILFQIISKLDDKYSSIQIVDLLENELENKLFKGSLFCALFFIFLWTLELKPICDNGNYLVNHSASVLIYISTVVLVVSFFCFVRKIQIYYTPARFIDYLADKHKKANSDQATSDLIYFKALSDVFLHALNKQNEGLMLKITRFYDGDFVKERQLNITSGEYRQPYYAVVNNSIVELSILKNRKSYGIEYRIMGGAWLLGEVAQISELTYSWLWQNILSAVKYEQDDMVLYHWEGAHQFMSSILDNIQPLYNDNYDVINTDEINTRGRERERFLEFHYSLGGLLLYRKRYACISRIFNYTMSQPPRYELLPETMDEIFKRFVELYDFSTRRYSWISSKYPFPEQNGIGANDVIKKWIASYLAVLFLRQYTIIPYYIYMSPLSYPSIPELQSDKVRLVELLPFFSGLLTDVLKNGSLLKETNFEFITKEYCDEKAIPYPLQFITDFKANIEGEFENEAINQPISPAKKATFINSSRNILERTLAAYGDLKNNINDDYLKWSIPGRKMTYSKDTFADNSRTTHLNYDSFLASQISTNIRERIAVLFPINKSVTYLLKSDEIFPSIDKLNIDKGYVLVNFGINLTFLADKFKVQDFSVNTYKDIQIINLPATKDIWQCMFILKGEDLPALIFNAQTKETIEKYSLETISENYSLYASVIDLNTATEEIQKEVPVHSGPEDLRKSVLVAIMQFIEIRWKKNIQMVQIIQYSEYGQKGLPNSIDDVVPLK